MQKINLNSNIATFFFLPSRAFLKNIYSTFVFGDVICIVDIRASIRINAYTNLANIRINFAAIESGMVKLIRNITIHRILYNNYMKDKIRALFYRV